MESKLDLAIKSYNMLKGVKDVTVALSGGADSMCLLYALLSVKDKYHLNITAAHLNHLIRGDEAFRDEEFVRNQCEKLGVPLFCERIDVPKFAKENKLSLELAARRIRYDFFKRVALGVVATAHTASDNIETVLFNLARGTSLKGLCGIPPKRDIFIRPLIFCARDDIECYCKENDIPYVTDSTNFTDEYTRNNIRHKIVPLLKQINPSLEYNTSKMCEGLREDFSLINSLADEYIEKNSAENKLKLDGFSTLERCVAKQIVSNFISNLDFNIELNSFHIENLYEMAISGGKSDLPGGFSAVSNGKYLSIISKSEEKNKEFSVEITEKETSFIFDGKKVNNLLLNNCIDCDKICGKLVVRTRQSGDKIRLAKRGNTKTLKKLYNESHIPLDERENLPVIADDEGVVFVHKIGVAQRCFVNEKTKKLYHFDIKQI